MATTAAIEPQAVVAEPEPTDAAAEALPGLPGLDVVDGLSRVGGNEELYARLLHKFATGQASAVDEIRAAHEAADQETCVRLAHTLKGVAANLGADAVQAAALAVESAAKAESASLPETLDALDEVLQPLVEAIAQLDGEPDEDGAEDANGAAETPSEPAGDQPAFELTAELAALLDQVEALLADGDTAVMELLPSLRNALASTPVAGSVRLVVEAAEDYDLDLALERLRAIGPQLGRASGGVA